MRTTVIALVTSLAVVSGTALAGLRFDFGTSTFLRVGYTSQWYDFDRADGAARFDLVGLELGWIF